MRKPPPILGALNVERRVILSALLKKKAGESRSVPEFLMISMNS